MSLTTVDQGLLGTYAQYTGFKNRIINGALNIWQRGTSVTPSLGSLSSYVSDRWASYQTGAATAINKQNGFNGQPNCLAFNGAASNTEVTMFQPIESVNCSDMVGQSMTLSVWLYSTVASKSVVLAIDTANSVDTFNATTQRAVTTVSVPSGTWTQYTLTYSNADSSVANGIRIRLNFGACTSGTYAMTGVQLEKGSTATSFDYRPYGTELALCQRYYWKSVPLRGVGVGSGANVARVKCPTPVTMRVAPTLSLIGTPECYNGSTPATLTGAAPTNYSSVECVEFDSSITQNYANGDCVSFYNNFSGSGIAASSEL